MPCKASIIDDRDLRRRLREHRSPLLPGEDLALHVWEPSDFERKGAPLAFRLANRWGHLFGRDAVYLDVVAVNCGVPRPKIHREGERMQHVDLCGRPLEGLVRDIEKLTVEGHSDGR